MASKLKDLQVTKVDFVDAGANPEANIVLFKRKPEEAAADPAPQAKTMGGFLHSVIAAIAKSVGATEAQIDAAVEEIAKSDAETFGEKMLQRQLRRTADEIWDYCYALQESLCSILRDTDVPAENKPALMTQSCTEFMAAVTAAIPKWSAGVPTKVEKSAGKPLTEERLQIAKEARARLDDMIQKAEPTTPAQTEAEKDPATNPDDNVVNKSISAKGENADMKIDKSKLSPEELATLDAIEKKAGIPEDTTPATDPVAKAAEPAQTTPAAGDTDDIYKGMHPAVAEELRNLRKFREETEDREILAVAKKYELLGKKPEELAPVLKSLKAAGGTAYADMIGILDANLAAIQASPAFNEIGKRGGNGAPVNDADAAWAQIEKKAEEIRKAAPAMTYAEAIDKACIDNPDLVHQYEANR
jgi:hypothetical protein